MADYTSLLIDVGDYSGRTDIAHMFPTFINLAEAKLSRALRVAPMETTASIALANGDGTLPADFLEAREVLSASGKNLRSWSLQALTAHFQNSGGSPQGYAIVGNAIKVRPIGGESVTVTYYGRIPALTVSAPTNWLIDQAPDVYLYSVCEEVAIWERDAAKVAAARELRVQAMAGLALLDERQRWGNSRVVTGGQTP